MAGNGEGRSDVGIKENEAVQTKLCAYCSLMKPLTEFKRRTGKRSGAASRRGACRACRKERQVQTLPEDNADNVGPLESAEVGLAGEILPDAAPVKKKRRRRRSKGKAAKSETVNLDTASVAAVKKPIVKNQVPTRELQAVGLFPNWKGFILMRGKTDNGRRWHQEIEPELALTLVKERAAVVVNRRTIRRLYSNKEFRRLILERDQYTCHFCGQYGDTIDHMLPRAKGGHTTPDNCVCACNLCNQSKADRDMDEFIIQKRLSPQVD